MQNCDKCEIRTIALNHDSLQLQLLGHYVY